MTDEQIKAWLYEAFGYFSPEISAETRRFAELVAAHEREAAAQIADRQAWRHGDMGPELNSAAIAAAIRARCQ